LARLRSDPVFESLHGDPEFETLADENEARLRGSMPGAAPR
jgi:hypothetical protein